MGTIRSLYAPLSEFESGFILSGIETDSKVIFTKLVPPNQPYSPETTAAQSRNFQNVIVICSLKREFDKRRMMIFVWKNEKVVSGDKIGYENEKKVFGDRIAWENGSEEEVRAGCEEKMERKGLVTK